MRADQAAQGFIHLGFKNLQGWRLSGQPVPMYDSLHGKMVLLTSPLNPHGFSLCLLSPIILPHTTEPSWTQSSSWLSCSCGNRDPKATSSSGWTRPLQPFPSQGNVPALGHPSGPPLDFLQFIHAFLLIMRQRPDALLCMSSSMSRLIITSLHLMPTLLPIRPVMLWAFFTARPCCCLMYSLLSTRTPKSFSAELLPHHSDPYWYSCKGFFPSQVQHLVFILAEFHYVPTGPSLQFT